VSSFRLGRLRLACLLLVAAFGAGFAWWQWGSRSASPESLLRDAQKALLAGDVQRATALTDQVLRRAPDSARGLWIAAEASRHEKRYRDAVRLYERVPRRNKDLFIDARLAAGGLYLDDLKRLSAAERQFRAVLQEAPDHFEANHLLAVVLGLSSRNREMIPCLLRILRSGRIDQNTVYLLATIGEVWFHPEHVQDYLAAAPNDPLPLITLARKAYDDRRFDDTERWLRQVVTKRPKQFEAQALLGRVLLEQTTDPTEFLRWHRSLSAGADGHASIWAVRALRAEQDGDSRAAARCLWEALKCDPNIREGTYRLAQLLLSEQRRPSAEALLERYQRLKEYSVVVDQVRGSGIAISSVKGSENTDVASLRRAARLAESLGLFWEAYGWSRLADSFKPRTRFAPTTSRRLESLLPDLPLQRTHPDHNPARKMDLSEYSLPRWIVEPDTGISAPILVQDGPSVRFVDDAESAGLQFTYFNSSSDDASGPLRMFEFTGGGVGVLDYDLDGWPDLHLTQGCRWPPDPAQSERLDRLFRNCGNGRFEDVTDVAHVFENGYSQGVSVGDFDDDGFPDLYICNVGGNRLFRNNGDGTFADVTADANVAGNRWTTSAAIADLNADGQPEIYAVNYLSGDDVFTRLCGTADRPEPCGPESFSAAQDCLYRNLGNGGFAEIGAQAGITASRGKGLGILVADLLADGSPDVFVANDSTHNFLFHNRTQLESHLRFVEEALPSGLAYNGQGRPEACMGIAFGDGDGNGLFDLFVTNFLRESNTYYARQTAPVYSDTTRSMRLHDSSMPLLGFGTEFLDGELDGWPDLIVTNGHVNAEDGPLFRMRPQYFRNVGDGRFQEVPASLLGPFFEGQYLGRSLARIDWNRDGLPDAVISHLDTPAALLTNNTLPHGNYLKVYLRGTVSNRDAVGAVVRIRAGNRTFIQQMSAGDGYQVSNEKCLHFGLGRQGRVDVLEVTWPNTTTQRFANLDINEDVLLVEGRATPFKMHSGISKTNE